MLLRQRLIFTRTTFFVVSQVVRTEVISLRFLKSCHGPYCIRVVFSILVTKDSNFGR